MLRSHVFFKMENWFYGNLREVRTSVSSRLHAGIVPPFRWPNLKVLKSHEARPNNNNLQAALSGTHCSVSAARSVGQLSLQRKLGMTGLLRPHLAKPHCKG